MPEVNITNAAEGSAGPESIGVAIVEDVRSLREGFWMLIDGTPGFHCTGSFRTMEEALEKIGFELPDIVLADIGLPGMSGIEGVRLLKERYPHLTLLMLTVYDDDDRIFDALCAGACGYLLKKTPPARLLESIKEAVSGGAPNVARSRAPSSHIVSRNSTARARRLSVDATRTKTA